MLKLIRRLSSSLAMKNHNQNFEFAKAINVYNEEYIKTDDPTERQKMILEWQYAQNFLSLHPGKPKPPPLQPQIPFFYRKLSRTPTLALLDFILKVVNSIMILVFLWDFRKMTSPSKRLEMFESKSHIRVSDSSNVRFSDVKGIDECREELEEIVDYLKNSEKYTKVGAKLHKGVLLTGQPGTGKTLLARAIAGEAGVKFFYNSGSDFDEMFVGLGASRVRELFQEAKKSAPCIIFIDEIDAMAAKRSSNDGSRQTLNQLLVEIDGFMPSDNIIVIGATNLPEAVDPALKRAGRLDKEIEIPLPDKKGRLEILELYLSKIKASPSINTDLLSTKMQGMTGAEIANVVNLSAIQAAKSGKEQCDMNDFDYAIDRVSIGIESRTMQMRDEDKINTAYHELGHAFMAYSTGFHEIHKITILPKGFSLGHTAYLPKKQHDSYTKKEIYSALDTALGGRAAEEVFGGIQNVTTGCSSDLAKAKQFIDEGIRNGMFNSDYGVASYGSLEKLGDDERNRIDRAGKEILDKSYERTKLALFKNRKVIEVLAKKLIEKETLTKDEFISIIKNFSSYNMLKMLNDFLENER